jgi:hypothetical protein
MTQQYGLRTTNNLSEVEDRNDCIDNLGIDRRDLPLLEGTSAAGVTEADYQAIVGLSSNLEQQITTITSFGGSQAAAMATKATITGDTFTGSILVDSVNNDRPYTLLNNTIIGPSTASFFSPAASGLFSTGGEYKLGPITATTVTTSGLNYTGVVQQWGVQFARYKNFAILQEQPSWTNRRVPLFLPPPTAISGCTFWLDAEYSEIQLDGSNRVIQWKGVGNGPVAVQNTEAERPLLVANVMNGKSAVRFDGSNDSLSMGNLGALVPTAGTLVVKVRILDGDYNIIGSLNNSGNRWNTGGGTGNLGLFTNALQTGFPVLSEFNGTFTFTVRASNAFGLEVRENGVRQDYKLSGFTYAGGDNWAIGRSGGASGYLNGDIHSIALFNRVLSDKEVRTIEEYFAWRYDGVYDPDRIQVLQLEDFESIELEDSVGGNNPLEA